MNETLLADLKLAVTEACGNAVRHAYHADGGVVRVRYRVEPEHIEIEVQDEGTAGIPGSDGAPLLNGEPLESGALVESGMGLAIIRAIVDELEIDGPVDGSGTVVRMRKRLGRA